MASSLAAQLSQIAAHSTNALNLKAQKAAHAKSLIFEPRVAASQSFDTLYALCHEGYQELCLLDGRFLQFQKSLFSEHSQEHDRTQMTAAENAELDKRLETFLGLVGARLRLNPAVKAVEWLVRRFRIHEYNTSFLITTFLPYHTLPIFSSLMSILPSRIPQCYKFLHPYIRSLTQPPRHVIVVAATRDAGFASLLNAYVLKLSNARQDYPTLLSFWASIMTESVGGMMDRSRSGRQGVQLQNEQDVVLRLLPVLNEGLAMKKVPELRIGCYMMLSIMASKGGLDDKLLMAMMEAVVHGWTSDTFVPGLVCLSILAQQRGAKQLKKTLAKELLKVNGLPDLLIKISKQRRIDKLVNGLCLAYVDRLSRRGDAGVISPVQQLLTHAMLSDSQVSVIAKSLLLAAYKLDDAIDPEGSARRQLAQCLVFLAEDPRRTGVVVRQAMEDSTVDMDSIEMTLQKKVRPKAPSDPQNGDVDMEHGHSESSNGTLILDELYSKLPTRTVDQESFLSHSKSHLYDQLSQVFLASLGDTKAAEDFVSVPVLRTDQALEEALYLTFFTRVWCGPYPVLARVAALRAVKQRLLERKDMIIDLQGLIPYVMVALSDPAHKVRQLAAELVATISQCYPADTELKKKRESTKVWAAADLYGMGQESKNVNWLSIDQAARLIREVITPALEECILDKAYIHSVLEKALNSSKTMPETPRKGEVGRLPQATRSSILSYLASHVINTPLYLVKLRLLKSLNLVRGVASMTRTKVLLPFLQYWAALSPPQAESCCRDEQLDFDDFEEEAVAVVVATDSVGLDYLAKIIKGEVAVDRLRLVSAVIGRMKKLWSSLKGDTRVSSAQLLLDVALWPTGEAGPGPHAQAEAMDLLRQVPLSTDVLLSFVNDLPTAAKLADMPPATKRRRTSHGEVARAPIQDSTALAAAIRRVTFVLQLVDGSKPEEHLPLLKSLFNTLAELQHFKSQVGSELGYLQGLVLNSLLTIMGAYKANRTLKVDRSAVRADLLVDCVQKTSSPQVQNAALLLIASLAEVAPELVLHSVMPIFTFMGSSVLRQNDEYSAHVIRQTINEVIPPLIASLRKEKGNPVTGAAELLLSFVAAYEHVPIHRRKGLFISLTQTLGPEDFLFALLAMLADKYGATNDIKTFAVDLLSSFGVDIQIPTALKYLELVADILSPKPTISAVLFSMGASSSKETHPMALNQLALLPDLLSHRGLIEQMGSLLERDDMDATRVRDIYSTLLEKLLSLADSVRADKSLHSACGDILKSLLGLLSTAEFVKSVENLLGRPNINLQRKILRSLEVRIDQERQSNTVSRQAMLGFLPQLTAIIRESQDVLYKHIAVACVDKIAEKYGKKDLDGISAAAETIASDSCLGHADERLRVMALLCLASLVEILREGIVPILPIAIPKALDYIASSIVEGQEDEKLHNAGYAFISALIQHLPYMVSGAYLDKLLVVSYQSAEADLDEEADESRLQCLHLAAKQIDAKGMFVAMQQNWKNATDAGSLALREYLGVLSTAIDKHPKATVTKHSIVLSSIFLNAFDLRRQYTVSPSSSLPADEIQEIEERVNTVALKMIYKFNDSTFRPIFGKLVEWSTSGLPKKDVAGRNLRLLSLYSFMAVFFGTLRSIVTSYATYLLDNVVGVLQTVNLKDETSRELWARALAVLVECFRHDQDDFWQTPSHFDAVAQALDQQFQHASSLPVIESLIPAIVELAAAADSPEHHKELNTGIVRHLRSETASIRLAAVRCEQALTDRLGAEWLSALPEMLPFISELQEDDDEVVERETHRWIVKIEGILGESLDSMLQ
ncbi:MAG: snoRNA-binding rRNA-processing protein utp10 [Claussenomyces sp. TS43310]|nr:MAG: snoRNA-binding rRNA-processing protein utp10 [Claussenomyces sp. TS43310]